MTIVHLVIDGEVAGGQMVALQFARAARRRGDRVLFVSPTSGAFTDLVAAEGMEVALIDLSRTFRLTGAWQLRALLRRVDADVLHTHPQLAGNILGRVAGALAGVAVVSHIHAENFFRSQRQVATVHRLLDNATARLCARILVVSDATRAALAAQGYPQDRMETVHNGFDGASVPAESARAVRRELGLPADALVVCIVGRLNAMKGQREAIEALARLGGESHLVIAGEDAEHGGAFASELHRLADDLGVGGRVHLTGYRADVPAVLAAADVFVLPSWAEGLPMVVLEAMAAGLPVVAARVGGIPELVVDGETGLLVAPRDVAALAAALGLLVTDEEKRRRLGAAGRLRLEREFTERAASERVLAVYDEVVAATPSGE